jgi:hypothetical protein
MNAMSARKLLWKNFQNGGQYDRAKAHAGAVGSRALRRRHVGKPPLHREVVEMKYIITALAAFALIAFFIGALSLGITKTFGPAGASVRREIYEETKSYRDGTRRDFDNLYLQYQSAKSPEEKSAVLSIIRHRASGAPPEVVPTEIRNLLK